MRNWNVHSQAQFLSVSTTYHPSLANLSIVPTVSVDVLSNVSTHPSLAVHAADWWHFARKSLPNTRWTYWQNIRASISSVYWLTSTGCSKIIRVMTVRLANDSLSTLMTSMDPLCSSDRFLRTWLIRANEIGDGIVIQLSIAADSILKTAHKWWANPGWQS